MPTNVIPPDILLELLRQGEKPGNSTISVPDVPGIYNAAETDLTTVSDKTQELAAVLNGIGVPKQEDKIQSPYAN